jgi:hypothetical protein
LRAIGIRAARAIKRAVILPSIGHDCSTLFGVTGERCCKRLAPPCQLLPAARRTACARRPDRICLCLLQDLRFALLSKADTLIATIHSLFCCSKSLFEQK